MPSPSAFRNAERAAAPTLGKPDHRTILAAHNHLLDLLREEAKEFKDPFLLYLYDMVIYRTRSGPE